MLLIKGNFLDNIVFLPNMVGKIEKSDCQFGGNEKIQYSDFLVVLLIKLGHVLIIPLLIIGRFWKCSRMEVKFFVK